ncbi:ABC transporter permease subunit, partial [Acetobacteraceae bacterium]|nr:ABC transporter permease subunit [Acetobacteraceae bacterium]
SVLCLLFGLPLALWLARNARPGLAVQMVWLCLTVPFFLDPSARGLALRLMLSAGGPVNSMLLHLHLVHQPVRWLLFSDFAVVIGLLGPYFPNMVWPIYLSLMLIDESLFDASSDLGASPTQTLRLMVLPLAVPGIMAGVIMTFIPALGDNVVPDLLGGGRTEYIADSVMALSTSMNYAGASAMATIVFA